MNLVDQSEAQGEALSHAGDPMIHSADVVEGLARVSNGDTGRLVVLEEKKVRKRRLRSFDLRRQDCLFPDIRKEELVRIG